MQLAYISTQDPFFWWALFFHSKRFQNLQNIIDNWHYKSTLYQLSYHYKYFFTGQVLPFLASRILALTSANRFGEIQRIDFEISTIVNQVRNYKLILYHLSYHYKYFFTGQDILFMVFRILALTLANQFSKIQRIDFQRSPNVNQVRNRKLVLI